MDGNRFTHLPKWLAENASLIRATIRRFHVHRYGIDEEDVFQEVVEKALRHQDLLDSSYPAARHAWFKTTARNAARDAIRRERRLAERQRFAFETMAPQVPAGPEAEVIAAEQSASVDSFIDSLDERDRQVIVQRYVEGLTITEISRKTGEDRRRVGKRIRAILSRARCEFEID